MNKDEALKLALEALKTLHDENMDYLTRNKLGGENNQCMVFAREAIAAIKESLAQPQQKRPQNCGTGYCSCVECVMEPKQPKVRTGNCLRVGVCASEGHKIAPQRTWVGLTTEDMATCIAEPAWDLILRKAEQILKEKNT